MLGIETALQWIVEWFDAYRGKEDMLKLTEAHIARYEELVRTA